MRKIQKILKNKILLAVIALLVTGGIFIYLNYYPILFLLKNNFDATATVPNTNVSFKYPSNGFYGVGIQIIDPAINASAGEDITKIKNIVFFYPMPIDSSKASEYIDFSIGFVMERDRVGSDYTLENAIKYMFPNTIGRYKTINGYKFYIYSPTDNTHNIQSNGRTLQAYFLQYDGVYRVNINYIKPINSAYGKEGDTAENRAAYKNNDKLFLKILKNIELK